jgi:hypothetical protein
MISRKTTYIPISSERAERSSMVGVAVFLKSFFKASSWNGSGRERLVREKAGCALRYGIAPTREEVLRGDRSPTEGEILEDRRRAEYRPSDGWFVGGGKLNDGYGGGKAEYRPTEHSTLAEACHWASSSSSFFFFA